MHWTQPKTAGLQAKPWRFEKRQGMVVVRQQAIDDVDARVAANELTSFADVHKVIKDPRRRGNIDTARSSKVNFPKKGSTGLRPGMRLYSSRKERILPRCQAASMRLHLQTCSSRKRLLVYTPI